MTVETGAGKDEISLVKPEAEGKEPEAEVKDEIKPESEINPDEKLVSLASSLSNTMGDYHNSLVSTSHILSWVKQPSFPEEEREFILVELNHVFKELFLTAPKLVAYLKNLKAQLEVADPTFWASACLVQAQAETKSQGRMNKLFAQLFGTTVISLGSAGAFKNVVYLDDALYTGQTLYNSLSPFKQKFKGCAVHVCVVFMHKEAKQRYDWAREMLIKQQNLSAAASVQLHYQVLVGTLYSKPDATSFFSSPASRARLHKIFEGVAAGFVFAGTKYKAMGLQGDKVDLPNGFGSPVATCSNCPNNAPVALWWPKNGWLPLLPRWD